MIWIMKEVKSGDFLDIISTLLPSFHLLMFCLQRYSISRIVNYIQDKQTNIYSQKSDHMVCQVVGEWSIERENPFSTK